MPGVWERHLKETIWNVRKLRQPFRRGYLIPLWAVYRSSLFERVNNYSRGLEALKVVWVRKVIRAQLTAMRRLQGWFAFVRGALRVATSTARNLAMRSINSTGTGSESENRSVAFSTLYGASSSLNPSTRTALAG